MGSGVPFIEGRLDVIQSVIDMTRDIRLKADRLGQARVLMPPGLIALTLRLIPRLISGLIPRLISGLISGLPRLVSRLISGRVSRLIALLISRLIPGLFA